MQFSFEIAYEDDPLQNKVINPVELRMNYGNDTERKFAKELTTLFVASKPDAPIKPVIIFLQKKIVY